MARASDMTWDPGIYQRFRGLRLRPALDLLRAVPGLPPGEIVDLGCGAGAVAEALRATLPGRRLVGVDSSSEMLEQAGSVYDGLQQADIAQWRAESRPALIFSNAALQWVDDHETLLPRLAKQLAPGGTLAIQVPHQNNAPSHRLWLSLSEEMFGHVPEGMPSVLPPARYHHLLSQLGRVDLWETEYYQQLSPNAEGHPVRCFTEATFARPVLQALDADRQARLIAA